MPIEHEDEIDSSAAPSEAEESAQDRRIPEGGAAPNGVESTLEDAAEGGQPSVDPSEAVDPSKDRKSVV